MFKRLYILLAVIATIAVNAYSQGITEHNKKISPTLLQWLETKKTATVKTDTAHWYKLVCDNLDELQTIFKEVGEPLVIKKKFSAYHVLVLQINDKLLHKILSLPSVTYADLYYEPKEELELGNFDPSLNRINFLHQHYPLYDGTGLHVSIKENKWDTLDIDFKGRYISSGISSAIVSGHASIMTTLIAGGGNTSPQSLGVAPGANLSSSSFSNLFPDAAALLASLNVSVQNHSYGTIVENFYGAEARAYDQQLNVNDSLLHIFSAGNSGTLTPAIGSYTGIAGVANITGNFKQAKNVIAVGATDSFYRVPAAISKGPAYDGRLKPEITAFAEDGSSGAAAIVSGVTLAVQHIFRQQYGTLPASALVRAILFNSADDIGAAGIDFSSGFGSLNAKRAAENIFNGRFFSGSVATGGTQNFSVNIPPGIQTVKFMLAWNDPAHILLTPKALVNDLDITVVRTSDNFTYQPWVLNPFPHIDSLRQLPKRKRDSLNNAEQVTIDNPLPGNYQVRVNGFSVPTGVQDFYIAWQFDSTAYFEFTHPAKNDQFLAGAPNTIRWQNTVPGTGVLQYTSDNINWNTIDNSVNLADGYYVWTSPNIMSAAKLRMITGLTTTTSDSFVISTPLVLETGFNCPEDFMLWWNKARNTGSYQLFRLGAKYLQPLASVADTFVVYTKAAQPNLYYAVQPVLFNGVRAQRSRTYNYTVQGVGCYIRSFLAELVNNNGVLNLELASAQGIQQIVLEKLTANGFVQIQQTTANGLLYVFNDNNLKTGLHTYRVRIVRTNGQLAYSDEATLYYFGRQPYLVYPNPVPPNGLLRVVASLINNGTITLYNMQGQPVLKYKMKNSDEQVSLSGVQSGVYFYTIAEEGRVVQSGKLVVY